MFGMGMGEIILIAVVALLVLGPERLPAAAKALGKGIRDLRQQTKDLQQTIEKDTEIGDAVRELRTALRGEPRNLYKQVTGEDFNQKPADKESPPEPPKVAKVGDADEDMPELAEPADAGEMPGAEPPPELDKATMDVIADAYANTDDGWGQAESNPHQDKQEPADPDLPVIRTPEGTTARGTQTDDDSSHG